MKKLIGNMTQNSINFKKANGDIEFLTVFQLSFFFMDDKNGLSNQNKNEVNNLSVDLFSNAICITFYDYFEVGTS